MRIERTDLSELYSYSSSGADFGVAMLFPGLRYAPPWAIFVSSLRKDLRQCIARAVERSHLRQQEAFIQLRLDPGIGCARGAITLLLNYDG